MRRNWAVLDKFNVSRFNGLPVSEEIIQAKTIELFQLIKQLVPEYQEKPFEGSKGWVRGFKNK